MADNGDNNEQRRQFTIKNSDQPVSKRCQICHQSDQYDPYADYCRRCQPFFNKNKVEQLAGANAAKEKKPKFYIAKEAPDDRLNVWKFRIAGLSVALLSVIFLAISLFPKK